MTDSVYPTSVDGKTVQGDGGQAFPMFDMQWDYGYEKSLPKTVAPGMTLRDYFAAKALPPVMYVCVNDTLEENETRPAMFARKSYEIADSMLKARQA